MFEFDGKRYATEAEANAVAERKNKHVLEWFWDGEADGGGCYVCDYEDGVESLSY